MNKNDVSFHSNFWSITLPLLSDRMGLGGSVQGLRDGWVHIPGVEFGG